MIDIEELKAVLEHATRVAMADLAKTPDRGFDTRKERAPLLAEIDGLLDDYNAWNDHDRAERDAA